MTLCRDVQCSAVAMTTIGLILGEELPTQFTACDIGTVCPVQPAQHARALSKPQLCDDVTPRFRHAMHVMLPGCPTCSNTSLKQ